MYILFSQICAQETEILSLDFKFEPYIIQDDECLTRVTSPECVAEEKNPAKDRKCKKVL